jgi:hypothetical protein
MGPKEGTEMGAERAVTAVTPGTQAVPLSGFNDVILATIKLVDKGHWILTGRVLLFNVDGDSQFASAKLVHDGNMVDVLSTRIRSFDRACVYVQAGVVDNGGGTVTLECNTFDGDAVSGSIVAIKVDHIDFQ